MYINAKTPMPKMEAKGWWSSWEEAANYGVWERCKFPSGPAMNSGRPGVLSIVSNENGLYVNANFALKVFFEMTTSKHSYYTLSEADCTLVRMTHLK